LQRDRDRHNVLRLKIRKQGMADEKRQEAARKGAATKGKEGMRAATLKSLANRTPEQLSAAAKRAAATRNRNRAAKKNEESAAGS
jgi:hypothetical protein